MGDQTNPNQAAYQHVIVTVLDDRSITDPAIDIARRLVPHSAESDFADRGLLEAAITRGLELRDMHQNNAELTALAQTQLALGVCYLMLGAGDDALESFQICAEMSEAHGERITQAWALAFHGLTKRALYELLKEDGEREIEAARKLFAGEGHEPGVSVIEERFVRLTR